MRNSRSTTEIFMLRVLRIPRETCFEGALIPNHAPAMTCSAPWHSGMACACGWMKAALRTHDAEG